jgi:ABC-2 type transport system ATP-binding protein
MEQQHTTIIISSHSLRELEDICDSYGLLDHHHIISSGQIENEVDKIHKFQLAFNVDKDQSDFEGLDIVHLIKQVD